MSSNPGSPVPESATAATSATRLYKMLEFNRDFVAGKQYETFRRPAAKSQRKSVIVTCMDTRLTHLLPHALNIKDGDAKIIKNAGAVITHPFGGIMRSVIVALYELNCDEVFVIGHHDCGMSRINPESTLEKMVHHGGIAAETLTTLEYAGINVRRWLHGFDSVADSVRNSVDVIRNHPLVAPFVPVHGLIINPENGALDLVIDGNQVLRECIAQLEHEAIEREAQGKAAARKWAIEHLPEVLEAAKKAETAGEHGDDGHTHDGGCGCGGDHSSSSSSSSSSASSSGTGSASGGAAAAAAGLTISVGAGAGAMVGGGGVDGRSGPSSISPATSGRASSATSSRRAGFETTVKANVHGPSLLLSRLRHITSGAPEKETAPPATTASIASAMPLPNENAPAGTAAPVATEDAKATSAPTSGQSSPGRRGSAWNFTGDGTFYHLYTQS